MSRMPQSIREGISVARVRALTLPSTGLDLVDRALAKVVEALRPMLAHPRADQTTLHDVTFASGVPVELAHHLNRSYRGWSVVRVRGSGATFVEAVQDPEALSLRQLTLTASADCVADVEVW